MGTASDIITRSLKRLGVVGAGEAVQHDDFVLAADRLTTLVDALMTEGAGLPRLSVVNQSVTWASLTPSYVTAPTAYLNSLMLYASDANANLIPLTPMTVQGWSDLQEKGATGAPDKFFDSPDGRWYLHPVPTTDPGLKATFVERPATYADPSADDVDFSAEWMLALEYGLTYHMADDFKQDARKWRDEWERLRTRALSFSVHSAPVVFTVDD